MATGPIPDGLTLQEWNRLKARSAGVKAGAKVAAGVNKSTILKPAGSDRDVNNTDNPNYNPGGGGGGGNPGGGSGGGVSAAERKAQKAGKDQARKQNKETQKVIDALYGQLSGYAKGRDQQVANANKILQDATLGITRNYEMAVQDYEETGDRNDEDYAAKSAANVTNRARERMSLLQQAATQGAGETDQLRAQLQAFQNADANQLEVDAAFYDTARSLQSQIAGAGSQAETQRRSAWNQNQEAIGSAWNDYWKNYGDIWSNIQRTAAANTNIKSDYSEAFKADYKGYDPVKEIGKAAGQTYKIADKDESWFGDFGRRQGRKPRSVSTAQAGAVTIKAPKAAEGATLRGRW